MSMCRKKISINSIIIRIIIVPSACQRKEEKRRMAAVQYWWGAGEGGKGGSYWESLASILLTNKRWKFSKIHSILRQKSGKLDDPFLVCLSFKVG